MFSSECANVWFRRCSVHHNRALAGAGGALLLSAGAHVAILDTSLAANSASTDGGAIACDGCAEVVLGNLHARPVVGIVSNSAAAAGGGLFVRTAATSAIAVHEGVIIARGMARSGGGVALSGVSHAYVGAALVANNTAGAVRDEWAGSPDSKYAGGGVALTGSSSIKLNHTAFIGNKADFGGALGADASAYSSVQGVVFTHNSAMVGGATYWASAANKPFDQGRNTYTHNMALWYGNRMATAASSVTSHSELCERLGVTVGSFTAVFDDEVGGARTRVSRSHLCALN